MASAKSKGLGFKGFATLAISALIGLAAIFFIARADGNVTAYVIGGAILVIMIYFIVATIVNWNKPQR
ncbi:hypothetical protein [Micromonospora sp. NPDC049679]|uniref:hypothetical protein n=1 Tax=Micromonospora sp. NPDC049679 TaxID=3155920 RepID=UPI0033E2F6DC